MRTIKFREWDKLKKKKIEIVLPPVASSNKELDLVNLTEYLVKMGKVSEDEVGCGLGGTYGYGVDFENDVFMMHSFCWCEQKKCEWCSGGAPNFLYKPTNFGINWYKWIGRSMGYSKKISSKEWKSMIKDCIESVKVEK